MTNKSRDMFRNPRQFHTTIYHRPCVMLETDAGDVVVRLHRAGMVTADNPSGDDIACMRSVPQNSCRDQPLIIRGVEYRASMNFVDDLADPQYCYFERWGAIQKGVSEAARRDLATLLVLAVDYVREHFPGLSKVAESEHLHDQRTRAVVELEKAKKALAEATNARWKANDAWHQHYATMSIEQRKEVRQ